MHRFVEMCFLPHTVAQKMATQIAIMIPKYS